MMAPLRPIGTDTQAAGAKKRRPAHTESLVQWALLGLVIERPSYGYELAQRFERSFGQEIGSSSASYIYTSLDVLRRRGLIEPLPGRGNGRQPKPGYRVTAAGLRIYCERLVQHARERAQRERLLARGLALLAKHPEAAVEVIDRCASVGLERARTSSPAAAPRQRAGASLVERLIEQELRAGAGSELPWLSYARAHFKGLSERTSDSDAPA
jgi:DNA-binding PadR family transcriptional regulator